MGTTQSQQAGSRSGFIRIDEELIAAAIHEVRTVSFAADSGTTMEQGLDCIARRPLLLLLLFELMVPGLNTEAVLAMVQQLVLEPAITKLQ